MHMNSHAVTPTEALLPGFGQGQNHFRLAAFTDHCEGWPGHDTALCKHRNLNALPAETWHPSGGLEAKPSDRAVPKPPDLADDVRKQARDGR